MLKKTLLFILIINTVSCISFDAGLCYSYSEYYKREYNDIVMNKFIDYEMHSYEYLILKNNRNKIDTVFNFFRDEIYKGDSLIKNKYTDTLLYINKNGEKTYYKVTFGCPKVKRSKIIKEIDLKIGIIARKKHF